MESENETVGVGGQNGEDLGLPKLTIAKLIQELMPDGFVCPKETRDLLAACCTEFVHLISSEANETCERAGRKTISPDHILDALKILGFAEYCQEVEAAWTEQREAAKQKSERQQSRRQPEVGGPSEEELARQQEELFEKARQKYNSSASSAATNTDNVSK